MEWHPKPISWASENKLLEPSSLDRILRQLLVPTLFAGAGGQRRHPSRGWQVQLELQVSGVTSPSYPGHSLQFWSKTQRFPFGTFQLLKVTWQSLWWQSLAAVRSRWQKPLGCRHFSCVQTQFWQIWWQLPTSHWQVSNRPPINSSLERSPRCKSRCHDRRNPDDFSEEIRLTEWRQQLTEWRTGGNWQGV